MDIQFTTKSQDALGAAVRIAAANGNPQVEPLHILDSLLQQGEGIAVALLDAVGTDVPNLTFQVRSALKSLPSATGSSVAQPTLNQASLRVLNEADRFAKSRGDEYVSTEHLLIALSKDGGEKVIHLISPGESFGEAAMFLDTPVPAATQAIQDSIVLAIPKAFIFRLIDEDPHVAHHMFAGMSMRMHRLIQEIKTIALQSASERVIGYILQLCSGQQGAQNISLPAKKVTIASLLNLTPETLSRTMTKLEKQGLIVVKATEIHIPDCDRLRSATLV